MSDSSDEDFGEDWVPYSRRPDFADITPIEQDDGENPVVVINYSNKFREVFNYVRAIMMRKEKSLRALELTKDALKLNPANYTLWQYRRDILKDIGADLYEELRYLEDVMSENAKNYQVWYHRRALVEILNDPTKELILTADILDMDAKNYHAWQYRQWVIKTYDLFEDELVFVDRLIAEDVRNNSAWNERFFVLRHYGFTPEVIQREIQYVTNRIRMVKNNESAWNYLIGILKQNKPIIDFATLEQYPEVLEFCEELYNNGIRSPYLLSCLVDIYKQQCLHSSSHEEKEKLSRKVYRLCDELSNKYDIIRRKYWQYIAEQFKTKLKNTSIYNDTPEPMS